MNTQMGSSLPSEKLDWSNYSSWEYKMNQFLVHQGHWSYNKAAKAQNRERTKPRRHKAAKAQNRAKPRRNKATKAQSHQGAKPRKATKATKSRREESRATKPHKPSYRTIKPRNAAQAKRTAQKRRVMRNHITKPQKITQTTERKAEQEPERPSLRYRLEGENKLRRATHNKAAKSCTQRSREEEPRNEDAKKAVQRREESCKPHRCRRSRRKPNRT